MRVCHRPRALPASDPCPSTMERRKGELALPAEGSIVLSPADEATLSPTAQILAQDLKELFGWNYVIKTGKPAGKDICLSLSKPDKELGEEGYTLTVNRYAGIAAPHRSGAYSGEHVPYCRYSTTNKESSPKGRHGIIRFSQTAALCWMWPANSFYNGLSETIRKDTFLLQDERISDSLERQRFSAVLRR